MHFLMVFGPPPFSRLVNEFRRRIIEEAIGAGLPGLVFTMVWGLELPSDRALVTSYVDLVEGAGGRVSFVEPYASLAERMARNRTEPRLSEKRSKRDLVFSDVRVDNTDLAPRVVAAQVATALGLA